MGTAAVIYTDTATCIFGSLKLALWLVLSLHIVNICEAIINLLGCDKKICKGMVLCGFLIFEVSVLIYMQVIYFQSTTCIDLTPLQYFWLMGQILIFYTVVIIILCYFFRKFCGDPSQDESDYEEEEEDDLMKDTPTEKGPSFKGQKKQK